MPERPKRRKNKNKRKNNKNTNVDLNKNNIVESDTPNVESSSDVINEENTINVDGEKDDLIVTTEISSTSNDVCQADITQIDTTTKLKDEIQVIPSTSQVCATSNFNDSAVLQHGEESSKEIIPTPEIRSIDNENYIIKPSDSSKKTNFNELIPSDICATSKECDVDSVVKQTDKELQKYIVETPDNITKVKCKLDNEKKSKSCDNDDCPTIVEITDDFNTQSENDNSLAAIDNGNVIITGEESDIEWEKVDHFNLPQTNLIKGVLSCDTIPLNIVHCEQITTLSPQEELSLRNYLKTLNLSTSSSDLNAGDIKTEIEEIINREIKYRLKKKGLTEENLYTRAGPSRSLAVIDEEGSGDSSKSSKRHSYLSDKISDNEELDDDVFESKQTLTMRRSNIDKINNSNKCLIPQQCIRVDAKLKEPEITEARGDWSMKTVEKMTGAELVYLTDSSSSTSSIYDVNDETDKGEDTDVSIRMITPTIEVTDTESLLSNTFLSSDKHNISKCDESTCEVADSATTSISNKTCATEELNSEICNSKTQNNPNEIIILRTDNIKTNLIVKDINEPKNFKELEEICENNSNKLSKSPKDVDVYDLEIKVLKCELNDAINKLINEVISDSENSKEAPCGTFTRQDSSSSVDSSQCTAKYNPTHSSLNDMSNILQDETSYDSNKECSQKDTSSSHVKDVLHCVTSNPLPVTEKIENENFSQPIKLRDMCVKKITSFPFGDKILEELAHVSLRLQNMSALVSKNHQLSKIQSTNKTSEKVDISESDNSSKNLFHNDNSNIPPPILPRKSSFKVAQEEPIKVIPKIEAVYECLSPSQKMLMEKTNTVISRDFKSQPNVNIRNEIGINQNDKISQLSISTPMKSETGSRLLALLRDTSNTHNLNTPLNKPLEDKNSIKMPKLKSHSETFSKRLLDEIDSTKQYKETTSNTTYISTDKLTKVSNSFKPIPPPKPKKSTYYYESDESSDFRQNSFQSMQSNKKYFHFSTGNLSKEIENDISTIQNMHKHCTSLRDQNYELKPRRPSLPKDLCDQQMEYIRQKEKEVDAELHRLEQEKVKSRGPRAPMVSETDNNYCKMFDKSAKSYTNKDFTPIYHTSKNFGSGKLSSVFSRSQEELLREKMYSEYVNQMAEREQRKQQKVIKVTQTHTNSGMASKSMPFLDNSDSKMNNRIEKEFISKARERWCKLGIRDQDTEDDKDIESDLYREPKVIEHKIKVIEGGEEKDVKNLPSHIQDFVKFTVKDKEEETGSSETVMIAPTFKARSSSPAIWRPGAPTGGEGPIAASPGAPPPPPPPPVWSPSSATTSPQTSRKTFRPVHFEETPPPRRKFGSSDQNGCTSGSESEGRLRTSQSAPATGLNSLGSSTTSRLPRAQNPTVTLLQKAREGQIPRPPSTTQSPREDNPRLPRDRPSPPRGDTVHALRKEYVSESEAERSDFERNIHKMTDTKKKVEGIGPTTKEGMPVTLRSEVKDPTRWYKKMYDTIHKNKYDEDYVTIRYKNRRGETLQRPSSNRSQYAYFDPRSGYLSEPEGGLSRLASSTWSDAYDSDVTSGPRRRTASVQEERRHDEVPSYLPNNKYSTLASARARQEVYKNQPGRIENYMPGKSSVIDKEAKQWWDEVMDIFDGQNESNNLSQSQASPKEKKDITSMILSKSNMARALKESGYESDSTLVFRRRDDTEAPLSPAERRAAYKDLQAGGEPPLRGFRSPAPPRQESPSRRYVESDVNIHYRCPVRHDPLPLVPERELARQQAEHMKRLYREQRRNKYLQENNIQPDEIESFDASMKELQDMQNRRHQDNFMPSQKTVVPLNRYDEAEKIVAKALYTFNGQTARELSFRKGDIINVRRQIDSNWYEGEVHGKIGLFPFNYVELLKSDGVQTIKKPTVVEGRARAKFDFIAQTNLELPLKKGEIVVLARRIDNNWWEGRNANRTGIFPDSYVTILQEPSQSKPETQPILTTDKPVASPAAHGLLNGTDKRSMGAHRYTPQPNSPALSNAPPATQPLSGYVTKSSQGASASERGYGPPTGAGVDLNNTEPLYVDTNAEAVPYRAMYKYRPQNPDELELNEGDTVYVLEKCDDGWYVGSSQRTGRFGTFPGNYVERI